MMMHQDYLETHEGMDLKIKDGDIVLDDYSLGLFSDEPEVIRDFYQKYPKRSKKRFINQHNVFTEIKYWQDFIIQPWPEKLTKQAQETVDFWLHGTDPAHPERLEVTQLRSWHYQMAEKFEDLRDDASQKPSAIISTSLRDFFNAIHQYHSGVATSHFKTFEDYLYQTNLPAAKTPLITFNDEIQPPK